MGNLQDRLTSTKSLSKTREVWKWGHICTLIDWPQLSGLSEEKWESGVPAPGSGGGQVLLRTSQSRRNNSISKYIFNLVLYFEFYTKLFFGSFPIRIPPIFWHCWQEMFVNNAICTTNPDIRSITGKISIMFNFCKWHHLIAKHF